MQILITGVAGFIGINISRFLLLNKNIKVYGIDNINDYYSISLKLDRIQQLKKFKNFKFKKIDITNKIKLENFFKNKNFSLIINLAAQAGVRYSLKNPKSYIANIIAKKIVNNFT